MEEGDEDPWNINIPDILQLVHKKKVNIGLEAKPKFENIGDY